MPPHPLRGGTLAVFGLVCALALPGCLLDRAGRGAPGAADGGPRDAATGIDAAPSDAGPGCVPVPEDCDGRDQDCDGRVDEALEPRRCEGLCGPGEETCEGGAWVCASPAPAEERCNSLDDDCDDRIDEELYRGCDTACGPGAQRCSGGVWQACALAMSRDETCDGTDEDCDENVDEGLTRPCSGTCAGGAQSCSGGAWGACSGDSFDESCNGFDDDCDDTVDEEAGCPCELARRGADVYLLCTAGTDWASAEAFCVARGYHLVTVDDADESAWLTERVLALADAEWWIGLNDRAAEGSWRWASGATSSFRRFHGTQPNSSLGEQDCVTLDDGDPSLWEGRGEWGDRDCLAIHPFACEALP